MDQRAFFKLTGGQAHQKRILIIHMCNHIKLKLGWMLVVPKIILDIQKEFFESFLLAQLESILRKMTIQKGLNFDLLLAVIDQSQSLHKFLKQIIGG